VDLIDQEHSRALAQSAQDRPREQEPLVEQRLLDRVGIETARRCRLDRAQMQDLASEVPVVQRLGGVDALVALQPDERQAESLGESLRERSLAGAGLAFEE